MSEQELTAKVRLNVRFPVAFFGKLGLPLTASATAARWVGFDPAQAAAAETELVYITPYGEAWHRDSGCVYLNPSIRQVPAAMLSILRSRDGSIYYPCPLCHPERKGWVCLTDYGTNYHKDTACAGLHRTPQVVTMEEAQRQGYHKCPKCGGIDQDR